MASRKPYSSPALAPRLARGFLLQDAALLAAVLGVALVLMARSGTKRAAELMPWPDGLEYAAAAVNLDQGRGAVLHFGGYSYPSRYTEGYPLILAAAWPMLGHDVASLGDVTIAMGLLAIVALYTLVLELFDRASAVAAAALLALSPIFLTYSTLVLSDVPTLALTIFAALALARATSAEEDREPLRKRERAATIAYWAIFGFFAGFTAMIRPTNAVILIGLVIALVASPPAGARRRAMLVALGAFAAGFAPMPLWQGRENLLHLGSVFASGYAWWVPEIYRSFSRTFNPAFVFGATMPRNPWGNLPIYGLTLIGLDGLLANPGGPNFYLYPFAAAVFAMVGLLAALLPAFDHPRSTRRVVHFGLGFLIALLTLYLFYVFTDVAFILPGCFIVFALAGYGVALVNRRLAELWSLRGRSIGEYAAIAGIAMLDLLLALSLLHETLNRVSAPPRFSEVVPALQNLDGDIDPGATVVSNLSLQFLELYLPAPKRSFVGLHAFDPGEELTDYHLARLYAKQAQGWDGPIPPALFNGAGMIAATADSLAQRLPANHPVWLLLWKPSSPDYSDLLKEELDRLRERFTLEEAARAGPLVLYRLRAPGVGFKPGVAPGRAAASARSARGAAPPAERFASRWASLRDSAQVRASPAGRRSGA